MGSRYSTEVNPSHGINTVKAETQIVEPNPEPSQILPFDSDPSLSYDSLCERLPGCFRQHIPCGRMIPSESCARYSQQHSCLCRGSTLKQLNPKF